MNKTFITFLMAKYLGCDKYDNFTQKQRKVFGTKDVDGFPNWYNLLDIDEIADFADEWLKERNKINNK